MDLKELQKSWIVRLNKSQVGHYKSSEYYKSMQQLIELAIIISTSVLTVLIISELSIESESTLDKLQIVNVTISVLLTALISYKSFARLDVKKDLHNRTAVRYGKLKRSIEMIHLDPNNYTIDKFKYLKIEWDSIVEDAPITSVSFRNKAKEIIQKDIDDFNELNAANTAPPSTG